METFKQISLLIHVVGGFTALLTGLIAIVGKKGTPFHKANGKIFFYSMLAVSIFGFTVAYLNDNLFLRFIALFALYTNYNVYRTTKNKNLHPKLADWLILVLGAVNGVLMILTFNVVLLVFGSLSVLLVLGDLNNYRKLFTGKTLAKNEWLRQHIGMMMGTYIATFTAFILVNLRSFEPYWIPWLAPTAIGIPLLFIMQRKHAPQAAKSKSATLTVMLILFSTLCANAQPYVEGGNTRHRFAQLYVGTEVTSTLFNQGDVFNQNPQSPGWYAGTLDPSTNVRVKIGGLHFWGHADFYVAFNVLNLGKTGYSTGIETGATYYPWRLENHKLRPYIGVAFTGQTYQYGDGAVLSEIKFPVKAGLGILHKQHYFFAGMNYIHRNQSSYYYEPDLVLGITTPQMAFTLGYAYTLETTASAEKNWQNGRTKAITDKLAHQNKLNGLTLGVGLSSAIVLKKSENYQFLDDRQSMNLFPDFAAGYYWHNPDIQLNASIRFMKSEQEAFGLTQTAKRQAYTLEAYKFIADYHGFAPFIGPTLSYENLSVNNQQEGNTEHFTTKGIRPGIVFGWDIRPNRLQAWYLRTNLRWCPNLQVATSQGIYRLDQLEINFIQLVVFPGRLI